MNVLLISSNDLNLAKIVSGIASSKTKHTNIGIIEGEFITTGSELGVELNAKLLLDTLYLEARKHPAYSLALPLLPGQTIPDSASFNSIGAVAVHQADLVKAKALLEAEGAEVKVGFLIRDSELANSPVMKYSGNSAPGAASEISDFTLSGFDATLLATSLINESISGFGITQKLQKSDLATNSLISTSPVSSEIDSISLIAERAANRIKTPASLSNAVVEKIVSAMQLAGVSTYESLPSNSKRDIVVESFRCLQINSYEMQNLLTSNSQVSDNFSALVNFSEFSLTQINRLAQPNDLLKVFAIAEHVDNSFNRPRYSSSRDRNLLPSQLIEAIQSAAENASAPYASDIIDKLAQAKEGIGINDIYNSPAKTLFYQASSDFALKQHVRAQEQAQTQTMIYTM